MIVAGDLNMNLGGKPYYGTNQSRALLQAGLIEADMTCVTETDNFPPDQLDHRRSTTSAPVHALAGPWRPSRLDGTRKHPTGTS